MTWDQYYKTYFAENRRCHQENECCRLLPKCFKSCKFFVVYCVVRCNKKGFKVLVPDRVWGRVDGGHRAAGEGRRVDRIVKVVPI